MNVEERRYSRNVIDRRRKRLPQRIKDKVEQKKRDMALSAPWDYVAERVNERFDPEEEEAAPYSSDMEYRREVNARYRTKPEPADTKARQDNTKVVLRKHNWRD